MEKVLHVKKINLQLFTTCESVLMFDYLVELDVTPLEATKTYRRLAKGIKSLAPANNDVVDQSQYLDGEGHGESEVTGMQLVFTVSGVRRKGDEAQDFVFGTIQEIGCGRKTNARITYPDGSQKEGSVTLANITEPNGDAATQGAISFEIHFNGKPTYTGISVAPALTATFAAGTVTGATSFSATPDVDNTLGYRIFGLTEPTAEDLNVAVPSLDSYDYTSGADILNNGSAIVENSYIIAYELTAYKRVVKAVVHQVLTAEIGS